MSNAYYGDLWLVTQRDMEKLLHLDEMAQSSKSSMTKDLALKTILPFYIKYRNLVRRLIMCHDQIIQPQKRELIKKVMDCAIGRMLEYNKEIVQLESNDYQWPDDLMIKSKFTPDDVTIPLSTSYVADREELLRNRRQYIDDLIAFGPRVQDQTNIDPPEAEEAEIISSTTTESDARPSLIRPKRRVKTVETVKTELHVESDENRALREAREAGEKALRDAIMILQSHERARTGRCIGARVERDYIYNNRLASGELEIKKATTKTKNKAATTIQKHWRGFAVREFLKRRTKITDELIDMTVPSWTNNDEIKRDQNNCRRRMSMQQSAVAKLNDVTSNERARIFRIKGPGLMEDITDEIRDWFVVWYNELGHFDVYPISEVGGSILIITGQTFTPEEYLIDKWNKDKSKITNVDELKTKEKMKKAGNKSSERSKNLEDSGWSMPEDSKALQGLRLTRNEFVRDWSLKIDSDDEKNTYYVDIINEKLCHELQLEMREIVDELMRLELEKLNEALRKDHADDKDKFFYPGMEKGKKGKTKRVKKKRGKKDFSSDMTLEKMFEELAMARIIKNYETKDLNDWQGDFSYQNYEAEFNLQDYRHRIGEIKQAVVNYCVLPLGSREVHAMAPLVRSVCICGLSGYGKTFLAEAICTSVGALLFDLTPSVISGLYEGKKNQEKLMSMIGKLAREHAPSIVFIDGGEKPWMKKIPPAERSVQPKRLAKLLPKFVKSIKPGDRILFLTLATEPQKAGKQFFKIYDKILIIPITDYNTIYMFYKKLLMNYHGVDRNFNVSGLARMSVGHDLPTIRRVVEKVMTLNRRITLKFKPLDPQEILDELLSQESPNAKIIEQFCKFDNQTPLGKNRAKMMNALKEARDNPREVKKNAKPKK